MNKDCIHIFSFPYSVEMCGSSIQRKPIKAFVNFLINGSILWDLLWVQIEFQYDNMVLGILVLHISTKRFRP